MNTVAHGGVGGSLEGMINLPIGDNMAFRGGRFLPARRRLHRQRLRNAATTIRAFTTRSRSAGDHRSFDNAAFVKKNFNDQTTYGGRAALKIDLNENWTVTPTIMHQNVEVAVACSTWTRSCTTWRSSASARSRARTSSRKYALTVEGKIANFDITYAGAYMHRPNYGDQRLHGLHGRLRRLLQSNCYDEASLDYQYYSDNAGNVIDPRQYIAGGNNFKKLSQELRIASPADKPFRVIGGAFYQTQTNDIYQELHVDGLTDAISRSTAGRALIWLTQQERKDQDYAIFGEASFDVTPQITLTAGGRYYKFNNTLFGFAGFGGTRSWSAWWLPPNAAAGTRTGVSMLRMRTATDPFERDRRLPTPWRHCGTPCIERRRTFEDGKSSRSGARTTASSIA